MKCILHHIVLLLLLFGCASPYEFDTDYDRLIIIDGRVNRSESFAIISYSAGYNSSGNSLEGITDAEVYLEDFSGRQIPFNIQNGNVYKPDSLFTPELDQTYILNVKVGEKWIISRPETIKKAIPFGLQASFATRDYLTKNNTLSTVVGHEIKTRFFDTLPENTYLKWKYEGDWEHPYTYIDYTDQSGSFFNVMSGTDVNKTEDNTFDMAFVPSKNQTYSQPLGFVISVDDLEVDDYIGTLTMSNQQEIIDSLTLVNNTTPVKEMYYTLRVIQRTISARAYEYWKSIKNQQDNTGSIFDPLPSRLEGNLFIPNSNEPVLGYFTAEDQLTLEYELVYLVDRVDNE